VRAHNAFYQRNCYHSNNCNSTIFNRELSKYIPFSVCVCVCTRVRVFKYVIDIGVKKKQAEKHTMIPSSTDNQQLYPWLHSPNRKYVFRLFFFVFINFKQTMIFNVRKKMCSKFSKESKENSNKLRIIYCYFLHSIFAPFHLLMMLPPELKPEWCFAVNQFLKHS